MKTKRKRAPSVTAKAKVKTKKRREGIVAHLVVRETVGKVIDKREAAWESAGGAGGKRLAGQLKVPAVGRACATIADTFASLGHPVRVKILTKLVEGPATYRAMLRVTKAKPGPLYHHLNQLRLSGLMLPKQRDLYELTRGGRNLIVGALALANLVRDGRRRPVVK